MILQLRCPTCQFPGPNGFAFTDPRTGFKVAGWEGTAQMNAIKIIANRRANPHIYDPAESQWFDRASVVQEIYAEMNKTQPELFNGFGGNVQLPVTPGPSGMVCSCGSTDCTPIYCATCSGQRVTGWTCNSCGKKTGR